MEVNIDNKGVLLFFPILMKAWQEERAIFHGRPAQLFVSYLKVDEI